MKKFGKITASSSAPMQPAGSMVLFPADENQLRSSFDENVHPRIIERGEETSFASLGKSAKDGVRKRRRLQQATAKGAKKPDLQELEKAIKAGHIDDIAFLVNVTTEGASHNLANLGFYKLSFVLPKEWTNDQIDRFRKWAKDSLDFVEHPYGQAVAYIHQKWRAPDIHPLARKILEKKSAPSSGSNTPPSVQTDGTFSRPQSLSINTLDLANLASNSEDCDRPGSKRPLSLLPPTGAPREMDDDESDSDDDTSPSMTGPSTFSPKSGGRSTRSCPSPFWGRQRALTSPADATLANFMESTLHIHDGQQQQQQLQQQQIQILQETAGRLTRAHANSSLGALSQSRSRGNSTADFMAGHRCPSRAGATILEESKEDVDDELAHLHPPRIEEESTQMPRSSAISPALPMSSGVLTETNLRATSALQNCLATENAAELGDQSDAATLCDEDDEQYDELAHDHSAMELTPSGTSVPRSAANSPENTIPVFNGISGRPDYAHPPRYPSDLADGPVMHVALKQESPSVLRRSVPEPKPSMVYGRGVPERPARPGKNSRAPQHTRALTNRAHTVPLNYHHVEASPGAAGSALGLGGNAYPAHYHTPVPIKPPTDVVEDYLWEESEEMCVLIKSRMIKDLKIAIEANEQKLQMKPRLQRAVSDPFAGTFNHSTPGSGGRGNDFLRLAPVGIGFGGISTGRESNGSVSSAMKALVCDRLSSESAMNDNDMSVCHSYSPCELAQKALAAHHRKLNSGSMLGSGYSPNAAFVPLSPKHSPGSQISVGANAHHLSSFHHGLDSTMPGFTEGSLENRIRKKRMNSIAKIRRISMCAQSQRDHQAHLQSIAETSVNDASFVFSPSAKFKKAAPSAIKTRAARRNNKHNSSNSDMMMLVDHSFGSHHSGVDCDLSFGNTSHNADSSVGHVDGHLFRPACSLNEQNFNSIVVGGTYQHCFDNASPLVAAPSAADARVVDVVIHPDGSLQLSLYLPKDKKTKVIDLGVKWQWMRCSPTGFLAFRTSAVNLCYFLPKHPDDWKSQSQQAAAAALSNSLTGASGSFTHHRMSIAGGSRARRVSIVPFHEFNPRPRNSPTGRLHTNSLEIEMDFQPLEEMTRDDSDDDDVGIVGDEYFRNMRMHSDDELNLSVTQIDQQTEAIDLNSKDVQEAVAARSEHANNAHLIALVLDFLIDDIALFSSSPPATQSKPTGRRRKESPPPTDGIWDAAVCQLQCCHRVSKTWSMATFMVIAQRKSSLTLGAKMSFDFSRFTKFATKFQSGVYLSEGVCKNVYCVYNPTARNLEALSVMDIDDLGKRDMITAVTQEIHISLLCSAMVTLKICPNLVLVNSLFQADYNVPVQLWGEKRPISDLAITARRDNVGLRKNTLDAGSYQYIRTEFCSGGDVEERLRTIGHPPDLKTVQMMLFQMCFSLYACREKLCMRHFDVKLLNFFVTTSDILHASSSTSSSSFGSKAACNIPGVTSLQIGLGQNVYNLPMQASALSLIKLADFGTSVVGSNGLGDPITIQQFTTLENTPPEFLILGSGARQSYAADTFPLGLCFFHLLTGYAPYEELLANVRCPPFLANKLRAIWLTDSLASPFYIIHDVVKTLDVESIDGEPEDVLLDTLYRYMVLFGLSDEFSSEESARSTYRDSPVWKALFDALDLLRLHDKVADQDLRPKSWNPSKGSKKTASQSARLECAAQYQRDVTLWSVRIGRNDTMIRLRDRLSALGNGADELLESLLHFDPSRRCTMYDAMQHPIFAELRLHPSLATAAASQTSRHSAEVVQFMHYYRGPSNGTNSSEMCAGADDIDTLPIL